MKALFVALAGLSVLACGSGGGDPSSGMSGGAGPSGGGSASGGSTATGGSSSDGGGGSQASGGGGSGGELLPCTKTFDPTTLGADPEPGNALQEAFAAAKGGEVFCLSEGDAGEIDLYNTHPSSHVTIQRAMGADRAKVHAYFNLYAVGGLTLTGMTMSFGATNGTTDVVVADNVIDDTCGIRDVPTNGSFTVTRNTFVDIDPCADCSEGRISVGNGSGVVISHNLMKGGLSDGIQLGGTANPPVLIEANEITGILQKDDPSAPHSDGIQTVGAEGVVIRGNWIHGNSDGILMDDGGKDVTIEGNVIGPNANGGVRDIEFGGGVNYVITHNTIWGDVNFGDDHDGNHTTGLTLRDNVIWHGGLAANDGQPVTYTVEDYNLTKDGGGRGAHDQKGAPTFTGGGSPTTFAGFALTASSKGHGDASDGKDRGAVDFTSKPGP